MVPVFESCGNSPSSSEKSVPVAPPPLHTQRCRPLSLAVLWAAPIPGSAVPLHLPHFCTSPPAAATLMDTYHTTLYSYAVTLDGVFPASV